MAGGRRIDRGAVVLHPGRRARIRVRDPRGLPLGGAVVRVVSDPPSTSRADPPLRIQEGTTDSKGLFAMEHLALGPARVQVRAEGFLPAEAPLPDSGLLIFDLKKGGRITVQVHAAPGTSPGGVPVICLPVISGHPLNLGEDSFGNARHTDAQGRVVFSGLGAETPWQVAVLANDYQILVAQTAEVGGGWISSFPPFS
ncbi:MAG: carboxypeptidase-like regulatory domain-containing protein [Planctomycetota bacterium]